MLIALVLLPPSFIHVAVCVRISFLRLSTLYVCSTYQRTLGLLPYISYCEQHMCDQLLLFLLNSSCAPGSSILLNHMANLYLLFLLLFLRNLQAVSHSGCPDKCPTIPVIS